MRKIRDQHQGKIAWTGAGLYCGGMRCESYAAFKLRVRAGPPCKLEVNA